MWMHLHPIASGGPASESFRDGNIGCLEHCPPWTWYRRPFRAALEVGLKKFWSEERKARLVELWNAGTTSSAIAAEFGDVSRNAVMGMVDRMGLMRSERHAAMSNAKRSGCCAPGWRKTGADVAGEIAVEAVIAAAETSAASDGVASPDYPPVVGVVADPAVAASPPAEVVPDHVPVVAEQNASPAPEEAASDPVAAAIEVVVEVPAADRAEDRDDVSMRTAAVEDLGEVVPASSERADAEPIVVSPPAPVAKRTAARVQPVRRPAVRPPSSRPWSASRMPPSPKAVPPPPEVRISSGVMSAIQPSNGTPPDWRDAFGALERLTGVPFDVRVPGHVPALVAIATVMSKGDPRRVLSPQVSEQHVLRFMRRFAEKGMVVAGKPPERWMQDVDDAAFYDEMVALEAA